MNENVYQKKSDYSYQNKTKFFADHYNNFLNQLINFFEKKDKLNQLKFNKDNYVHW